MRFPTTDPPPNDDAAHKAGFDSLNDLLHHVAAADLSTPERLAAFEQWKAHDGTKAGLLALSQRAAPPKADAPTDDEVRFCARVAHAAYRELFEATGHKPKPTFAERENYVLAETRKILAGDPPPPDVSVSGAFFRSVVLAARAAWPA